MADRDVATAENFLQTYASVVDATEVGFFANREQISVCVGTSWPTSNIR